MTLGKWRYVYDRLNLVSVSVCKMSHWRARPEFQVTNLHFYTTVHIVLQSSQDGSYPTQNVNNWPNLTDHCVCAALVTHTYVHTYTQTRMHARTMAPYQSHLQDCSLLITTLLTCRQTVPVSLSKLCNPSLHTPQRHGVSQSQFNKP